MTFKGKYVTYCSHIVAIDPCSEFKKIPTQRTTFGLSNNSNFPLFICCGPDFRTKLWPQGGRVPSVTQYFFALSNHEIFFQQFKQNIFLSKHVKCVVLYLPWLLSALFDLCLCGRRRVSSVQSSVGEAEG